MEGDVPLLVAISFVKLRVNLKRALMASRFVAWLSRRLLGVLESGGDAEKPVVATLVAAVRRGAGRKANLGGEGIPVDLKFLNRFGGDIVAGPSGNVLILTAVNRDEIVTPVAATDREARALEARNATRKLGPGGR